MSGEKTEQPTEKKIRDARKDGQVAKSQDLSNAFTLLVATAILSIGGSFYLERLQEVMKSFFQPQFLRGDLELDLLLSLLTAAWSRLLLLSLPFLVGVMVIGAAVTFLQVKPLFAPKTLQPKPEKIDPIKGFKNKFFKPRTYFELAKNIVKFVIVASLVYLILEDALSDIVLTARQPLLETAGFASDLLLRIMFQVSVAFLFIGAADVFIQQKLHIKDLKMSKDEVKREYKEEEGDPLIKQARSQAHQEVLSQSTVQSVPSADVVIVNPTHLAVALQYDQESMYAPQVTAKGQNVIAERIRELAKQHKIPVLQNMTLARSLFELEIGTEIPEDLYEAVAEVLNWVYMLAEAERNQ